MTPGAPATTPATAPARPDPGERPEVSVVVITHDRRDEVLATLGRLTERAEAREVIVVDNASTDGTAEAVRRRFPTVRVLALEENLGAVGRTVGVRAARWPVVAFADDDSWWEPGALRRAAGHLARHPRLGLLCGRIVVGEDGEIDPACAKMASAPLGEDPTLPGPPILGHLGCGAVVRRAAYLDVGGYSELLEFGGEEQLLSLDLAAHGWAQCYADDVVAHHRPSPAREPWPVRWARYRRNDTLIACLRLPPRWALRELAALAADGIREPVVRPELRRLVGRLPRAWRRRRPVPAAVVHDLRAARRPARPPVGAA